ncbi:phage tail assembly chaperone [Nitrosomonas oligotropha]|uniref:phage tail assembly chaperone n=1 Tax=Nitrosomonas oligotropha TaxID=42354 RepID=UPI00136A8D11|nr:phage tail assembly chaperone [Nitrosomonas oligotropha]MXS82276.1 hypothetical protein [Nitrosomonas oligotropha]
MFKVEKPKDITWPVTVSIPRDGGNAVKATFTGKFKILPSAEFNAIYNNGGSDEDLICNVMTGWNSDLCDEDGNSMEFNEENLSLIASVPYIRSAIVSAYLELSNGKKAARKN